MYKRKFGKQNKMKFSSPEEYYETVGFLAKSDDSTSFYWEHNEKQGAWGSEGRIHCYSNLTKFPEPLKDKFTKGRPGVLRRINCNEFVQDLNTNHNFNMGKQQDQSKIRTTIPKQHLEDFERGLNL